MLKFLRKYNTWIMVIAGSLLMVAWLLGQTISELGKRAASGVTIRVDGVKVPHAEWADSMNEFQFIKRLFGDGITKDVLNIENGTHWYMLATEAEKAGLVGGPTTGRNFIPAISRQIADAIKRTGQDISEEALAAEFAARLEPTAAESRMTAEQGAKALARLQGVGRMRALVMMIPRFSDRRLAQTFKSIEDSVGIDFVFVPSDREVPSIDRPTDEAIGAFFAAHKDVKAGDGEFGAGYTLPPRMKLEFLMLDRAAIEKAVTVDPVEVQKRFLRKYPDGKVTDDTPELARMKLQDNLRREQIEAVFRAADQGIRSEVDKAVRAFPQDGRYWKLPADWAQKRPTLEQLSAAATQRVKDATGVTLPMPVIERHQSEWMPMSKVGAIEGLGRSFLSRGGRGIPATQYLFAVKELAGSNPAALQVGLPSDALTGATGNRYYVVVTDVRNTSPPDSVDEVRPDVIRDMMQIEGFRRLEQKTAAMAEKAAEQGLEAVAKAPPTVGVVAASDLPIEKATVKLDRVSGTAVHVPDINDEAFRNAVLAAASKLDPTKTLDQVPAMDRIVAVAIPKSRGVVVAKITALNPVTIENFRARQDFALMGSMRKELDPKPQDDPYAFETMAKRLKVEIPKGEIDGEDAVKKKPADAAKSEPAKSEPAKTEPAKPAA